MAGVENNKIFSHGYTEGICDVIRRKSCENKLPEEIIDWMDGVLDEYTEWAATQKESLIVIDEGTILGDAAKKCKNTRIGSLILHVSSLADSKRKNVWLMAQSPYVGPLGLELGTTSQVVAVALVSGTNTCVTAFVFSVENGSEDAVATLIQFLEFCAIAIMLKNPASKGIRSNIRVFLSSKHPRDASVLTI